MGCHLVEGVRSPGATASADRGRRPIAAPRRVHYDALMDPSAELLAATIGARVKQERQSRSWTLDQLAKVAGVSRRTLVNVEQGSANPSVGVLLRLSDALGLGLPALVEPPATPAPRVVRLDEGALLWTSAAGGRGLLKVGTAPPEVVELWDWTLGPKDHYASGAHSAGTRELVHVVRGSVRIETTGREVTLRVGDAATFAGDADHAYVNPTAAPARLSLVVFQPHVGQAS